MGIVVSYHSLVIGHWEVTVFPPTPHRVHTSDLIPLNPPYKGGLQEISPPSQGGLGGIETLLSNLIRLVCTP